MASKMQVFTHAAQVSNELAASVAALEIHCARRFDRPVPDQERLEEVIRKIWPELITDAQVGRVSPDVKYLSTLYDRLAAQVGITNPGNFADRKDISWIEFYTDGCGDEQRCEDAWVIAELFWGGYVPCLQVTSGWLLVNAIRIQQNLVALTPTPESTDRFTDDLRWSGPEAFDAESLRGLFYDYEKQMARSQRLA